MMRFVLILWLYTKEQSVWERMTATVRKLQLAEPQVISKNVRAWRSIMTRAVDPWRLFIKKFETRTIFQWTLWFTHFVEMMHCIDESACDNSIWIVNFSVQKRKSLVTEKYTHMLTINDRKRLLRQVTLTLSVSCNSQTKSVGDA